MLHSKNGVVILCFCLQAAGQDPGGSGRQISTDFDTSQGTSASETVRQHSKRRKVQHSQRLQHQTDSDRSTQLGMPAWQQGHSASQVTDDGHSGRLNTSVTQPPGQFANATPCHSDCCSESPMKPHAPPKSSTEQLSNHASKHGQPAWRLQQEHQSSAAAAVPASRLLRPAHLKRPHEGQTQAEQPSAGVRPCRADFSWTAALISACLPSQQPLKATTQTEQHASPDSEPAAAPAQPALPAKQAMAHSSDAAATVNRNDDQQGSARPQQQEQQPQQPKAKHVAFHGNYHRYYGTRVVGDFEADPRLKVIEPPAKGM